MKKKTITLIATLSMLCFVACGNESTENATTNVGSGSNQEAVAGTIGDEPTVKPVVEATAEPTEEPVEEAMPAPTTEPTKEPMEEATPAPTEEPSVVYEGIDMMSDLPGEEWVETFVGIIDEPKIVVFSDETGRKEIFENDSIITINPETDMIGIYLPNGYNYKPKVKGITESEMRYVREHFLYYKLSPEETREQGIQNSALYAEYNGEEIILPFVFKPE